MTKATEALTKYRHSPKGVLTNIYHKMIERSNRKGLERPNYSLKEFHSMFLGSPLFMQIFKVWESGGYQYYDIPSIDRENPNGGYTKDNIQIMTWRDNRRKGDRENAIRITTPIIMFSMSGDKIREFESTNEAVKVTGFSQGLITACCQGRRNHTHGFKFEYRGDKFRKSNVRQQKEIKQT